MKKLYFLLLFGSVITFGQTQIGTDINGEFPGDNCGHSVSFSSDGSILAIGSIQNNGNGQSSGHVRIFKKIANTWTQIGADIDGEADSDYSGWDVSLSSDGNIVAIGAPNNDGNGSNSGHVRVFQNISGTWMQIGADINGEFPGDYFGDSVSLSSNGSIVAIGAPNNDGNGSNSGHVRVYQNISGTWIQIGSDINGEALNDYSGKSLSLSSDGSIVAIGAADNDGNGTNSGHVRVYQNISGTWTQIGIDINGELTYDYSGCSVSLSSDGSILAIGANENDGNGNNSGHVRVFRNISGTWTQIGTDINGSSSGDYAGIRISLSSNGNIVAIGANGNNNVGGIDSGHVRIFKNTSGTWSQIGSNINGEAGYDFSCNVSLSSNATTVAVGAVTNDGNGTDSGHVRIYDLSVLSNSNTFVLENFSIYPNPTSDFIKINLENNLTLEKVTIYTTLGQIIKSEKSKTIDVKSLAKGNYFVEVITNQGKATKTIIIE
jgi:hypothetical protein